MVLWTFAENTEVFDNADSIRVVSDSWSKLWYNQHCFEKEDQNLITNNKNMETTDSKLSKLISWEYFDSKKEKKIISVWKDMTLIIKKLKKEIENKQYTHNNIVELYKRCTCWVERI